MSKRDVLNVYLGLPHCIQVYNDGDILGIVKGAEDRKMTNLEENSGSCRPIGRVPDGVFEILLIHLIASTAGSIIDQISTRMMTTILM